MKVLFLCGSLEPGKDGVGDYCRRLAAELIRSGNGACIIALNDYHINQTTEEVQADEETLVPVMRIGEHTALSAKIATAQHWIQQLQPQWISLQYVPYAFHSKGLPFSWINQFKRWSTTCRWHVMFHELWIGSMRSDSLKMKAIGLMQRRIIKNTINSLRPNLVTTSLPYYQTLLRGLGQHPCVLPIFSNLPQGRATNTQLYEQLPVEVRQARNTWYITALFGSVHTFAGLEASVAALEKKAHDDNKKLMLIHVGRCHTVSTVFKLLKQTTSSSYYVLGEQNPEDIASFFHHIDFGLSTYNNIFLGKSGSIAAMLYNQLPVILLKGTDNEPSQFYPYAQFVQAIPDLATFCNQNKKWSELYGLKNAVSFYTKAYSQING